MEKIASAQHDDMVVIFTSKLEENTLGTCGCFQWTLVAEMREMDMRN